MTKKHYLMLCEAQGLEPDPAVMPWELDDFPEIVETATIIYNKLRDVYIPGDMPHFIGKDLAALDTILKIYEVLDPEDQRLILDVITIYDFYAVKASRTRIEAEMKKMKAKGKKP